MKNLIFGLIATVFIAFNGNAQDLSSLNSNKDFQMYLLNEYNFIKNCNIQLVKKIGEFKDENDLQKFYQSFNTNEKKFSDFTNQQSKIILKISQDYKFKSFKEDELIRLLSTEILEALTTINILPNSAEAAGTNCKRRYNNALAINLAAALTAHLGCTSLDLAVIPGLICHGVVAVAHAAADDNAYLDYIDCLNN